MTNIFSYTTAISSTTIDSFSEDELLDEIINSIKEGNFDKIAVAISTLVEYGLGDTYEEEPAIENYDTGHDVIYYQITDYLQKYRPEFYEKYKLLLV